MNPLRFLFEFSIERDTQSLNSFSNILALRIYSAKFHRTFDSRWQIFVPPILISICLDGRSDSVPRIKYICVNLYNKSHTQCKSASIRHSLHFIQMATWLMVARCFRITFRSGWHLNMQKVWIKCHELVGRLHSIGHRFHFISNEYHQFPDRIYQVPKVSFEFGRHYARWYNAITGRTIDNCVVLYHYFSIIVINLWNTIFYVFYPPFRFARLSCTSHRQRCWMTYSEWDMMHVTRKTKKKPLNEKMQKVIIKLKVNKILPKDQ